MKRTPFKTGVSEIDSVPTFENVIDKTKNTGLIRYTNGGCNFQIKITDGLAKIENRCWMIFRSATADKWEKIWNIFVHAHLGHYTYSNIYITSDDAILKRRDNFIQYPIGRPVNILSVEEGREVMDTFAKNLGFCFLSAGAKTLFTDYYLVSLYSHLPHYHTSPPVELINTKGTALETLGNRFIYVLKCIDKMNINYYHGMSYDISNDNHFYFNYFIILVAGIFDSLALYTEKKYDIKFGKRRIASAISLRKESGENFLKEIRKSNPHLRNHIAANAEFIDLINIFRESIVHREFQKPLTIHSSVMKDSLIRVESDVTTYLSQLKDKKSKYDECSEWGHIKDVNNEYISPYLFSKKVLSVLIVFVDKYLEKLGFNNSIVEMSEIKLKQYIRNFQDEGLGYKS